MNWKNWIPICAGVLVIGAIQLFCTREIIAQMRENYAGMAFNTDDVCVKK